MQSIGARLAETRKRKGISLREAADTLNVAGDILDNFENDIFNIGLPEIFVRGFLRNYATLLGLDPAKLMVDYNAFKLGESKIAKRDRGELLGRLDLPNAGASSEKSGEDAASVEEPPQVWPYAQGGPGPALADPSDSMESESKVDYSLYWKLGLAGAGVFAVLFLFVYIIWSVIAKPEPDLSPQLVETPAPAPAVASTETQTQADQPSEQTILLMASGKVDVLVVDEVNRKQLYRGSLNAGDEVEVVKTGPVMIAFSEGQFLEYEKDGQRFQPKSQGLGRMTVP